VDDRPTVEELNRLYASLTRDERDDLLQGVPRWSGLGFRAPVQPLPQ